MKKISVGPEKIVRFFSSDTQQGRGNVFPSDVVAVSFKYEFLYLRRLFATAAGFKNHGFKRI